MRRVTVKDVYTGKRATLSDSSYNEDMKGWAAQVQRLAKQEASAFTRGKRKSPRVYQSGHKKGKSEGKLRNSVSYKMKADSGEVAGIAFTLPVHGIFREYGVSNGHHRDNINRSTSDWLSGSLDRKEEDLVQIVAEHEVGAFVKTFMGIKK